LSGLEPGKTSPRALLYIAVPGLCPKQQQLGAAPECARGSMIFGVELL